MPVLTEQATAVRARDPLAELSPRERQIFDLIGQGYRPAEIGTMLGIAADTVGVHRGRMLAKLGIANSIELEKLACAIATQRLRTALNTAVNDFATVADLAGPASSAGAYALAAIGRITVVVEGAQ